ncbi:MAG TPA: hypothetical protein PLQ50_00350 [Candidatus Woesebacteria bacterium]|nr:hypothetical protein [Candidatus Woesebacteria bacterium]
MKFVHITNVRNQLQHELLSKACSKLGIEYLRIDQDTFDFSTPVPIQEQHLLYRSSTTEKGRIIEQLLINTKSVTFYKSLQRAQSYVDNVIYASIIHQKNNIPIPKTIFALSADRSTLVKNVKHLGGFPIILKAVGGSHGVGVVKIDSLDSLFSVVDLLMKSDQTFILRSFIKTTLSARLIVIGNQVVDSIEYSAPEGDFRSNEGSNPKVAIKKYSQDVENIAIKATQLLGLDFSGVDIIFDEANNPYLTEVNFPCFFPRAENISKTAISEMMLQFLLNKSRFS